MELRFRINLILPQTERIRLSGAFVRCQFAADRQTARVYRNICGVERAY
jgi:hypothetical protein